MYYYHLAKPFTTIPYTSLFVLICIQNNIETMFISFNITLTDWKWCYQCTCALCKAFLRHTELTLLAPSRTIRIISKTDCFQNVFILNLIDKLVSIFSSECYLSLAPLLFQENPSFGWLNFVVDALSTFTRYKQNKNKYFTNTQSSMTCESK